jgi:hypothetical protein
MTKCRCVHGLSWFRVCPACVEARDRANEMLALWAWDTGRGLPLERRLADRRVDYSRRSGTSRRAADRWSPEMARMMWDMANDSWYGPRVRQSLIYED